MPCVLSWLVCAVPGPGAGMQSPSCEVWSRGLQAACSTSKWCVAVVCMLQVSCRA